MMVDQNPTTAWQPIKTAPEGCSLVWLPIEHFGSHIHTMTRTGNLKVVGGLFLWDLDSEPTHWMPLPEPPVKVQSL